LQLIAGHVGHVRRHSRRPYLVLFSSISGPVGATTADNGESVAEGGTQLGDNDPAHQCSVVTS
jgi:hypothetical protein